MQVKITKIYTTDKDKQGNALIAKSGRPYTRLSIKTQEYGDKWISGFKGKESGTWREGDTVEVNITEKQTGDKTYLNFEVPKKEDENEKRLVGVEMKMSGLALRMGIIEERLGIKTPADYSNKEIGNKVEYPDEEHNPDEIPF